jgi:hypothetical protein
MTNYITISQKTAAVLDTRISILYSDIISSKQLASTASCYSHVLKTDLRQELLHFAFSEFVFVNKDFVLEI